VTTVRTGGKKRERIIVLKYGSPTAGSSLVYNPLFKVSQKRREIIWNVYKVRKLGCLPCAAKKPKGKTHSWPKVRRRTTGDFPVDGSALNVVKWTSSDLLYLKLQDLSRSPCTKLYCIHCHCCRIFHTNIPY
jgi:hypothetical protein